MRPRTIAAVVLGAALLAAPAMASDFGVSFHYSRGYRGAYCPPPVVYRHAPRVYYSHAPVIYRSHYRPYYRTHYRTYSRYYARPHYYRSYRYCR